ncbi:MAG: arginine repressor [Clostridia bacterium]|nr:arginine repressor [Clostridia bacterium]
MKKTRQELIAKLIHDNDVGTQEELLELLTKEGVSVTQATVSRDIKEMRIAKRSGSNGEYKYCLPSARENETDTRLYAIIANAVLSSVVVAHEIVVKCHPGTARAVASAADALQCRLIAGTIAGDDTVLVICHSEQDAVEAKTVLDTTLAN